MDKKAFTENEFTQFIDSRGHDLNSHLDLEMHCNLKIKPDDFYDFIEAEWMSSAVLPYEPRPSLSKDANEQMRLANLFGYHTGNTIKRDWGKLEEHNEHLVMLEERKVKALEKIANTVDALTLWFEDIDKTEWSDRLQWYLAELHAKFLKEDDKVKK